MRKKKHQLHRFDQSSATAVSPQYSTATEHLPERATLAGHLTAVRDQQRCRTGPPLIRRSIVVSSAQGGGMGGARDIGDGRPGLLPRRLGVNGYAVERVGEVPCTAEAEAPQQRLQTHSRSE